MRLKYFVPPILFGIISSVYAQNTTNNLPVPNPPQVIQVVSNDNNNRVNLNATGKQEVDQDYLIMTLTYSVQNTNAKVVQDTLNKEITAALQQAKSFQDVAGKKLIVRSGQFSVYPRYEKQQLVNWAGQGSIVLEGTDFSLIGNTAAQLNRLVVSNISLGISPEKRDSLKDSTVKEAITNFKVEAQKVTELFGFKTYHIKEISVNYNSPVMAYRAAAPMMSKMETLSSAPIAVEPGKTTLEANVSGSIEMLNQ